MKKNCIKFSVLALVLTVLMAGCGEGLKTTDLSSISLDGLSVGDKIDDDILTSYTQSERYSGNYKYKFEEIIIDTNDSEEVTYLFARFDENYIDIKVNGENPKRTEDVKRILGENYQDKDYDREQKLRELVYVDNDKGVKAEFVYSSEQSLRWIELSKQ